MTHDQSETLANLRFELEQVMANLRHYNVIHYGILAVLIPITTTGFSINVVGNEVLVICTGVASILLWFFFIFVTNKYATKEIRETVGYGMKLCQEIRVITDYNNKNHMKLMEIIEPPKINYTTFQFIFGISISFGWILYLYLKLGWMLYFYSNVK